MSDPGRSAEGDARVVGGRARATTDGRRATTACNEPNREVARRGTTKDATRAAAAAACISSASRGLCGVDGRARSSSRAGESGRGRTTLSVLCSATSRTVVARALRETARTPRPSPRPTVGCAEQAEPSGRTSEGARARDAMAPGTADPGGPAVWGRGGRGRGGGGRAGRGDPFGRGGGRGGGRRRGKRARDADGVAGANRRPRRRGGASRVRPRAAPCPRFPSTQRAGCQLSTHPGTRRGDRHFSRNSSLPPRRIRGRTPPVT